MLMEEPAATPRPMPPPAPEPPMPEAPPPETMPQLRPQRPMPPPPETMPPDPTTVTSRPEAPPDPARLRWQDDEDLYRSIQGQRPKMEKPGLLNKIAGAAMGGLGGYLMSSHRPGAQVAGQQAMGLIPEIMRPGHKAKMQEWSQDLDLAKNRADRSKAAVKAEEDIREGESNREYKKAQGDYYKALPGIRSEQTAATKATKMVTITPEMAKELGYSDDEIGEEIPVARYNRDKQQKGFRDHDSAKMAELEKKLEVERKKNEDNDKRIRDIEAGRNTSREKVATTQADAKVRAAGISANRPKPMKLIPRGVKQGDKTMVAYIDENGDTVVTEHELGAAAAKQDPWLANLYKQPESQPGAAASKPAAAPAPANPTKPNPAPQPNPQSGKKIRIKSKITNKTGTILESQFDPAKHEKL